MPARVIMATRGRFPDCTNLSTMLFGVIGLGVIVGIRVGVLGGGGSLVD
jgi:hypothetical protein